MSKTSYTILLYKGNSEKHALVRTLSHCKPWRRLEVDDWDDFLISFVSLTQKGYYLNFRGATPRDEDWILSHIEKTQDKGDEKDYWGK